MTDRNQATRNDVRKQYGKLADDLASCCDADCCGDGAAPVPLREAACRLGYDEAEVATLPEDQTMTLGCGNPVALAGLQPGETVLDLGSGAGFDSLLAAARVGPAGRVIGVDMTPSMLDRARAAAADNAQVEFRLGEIEHLPVADGEVDVIMSNCVINLSPEKPRVFGEAFRALRPGGRLAVSDVVALRPLAGTRWGGDEHLAACISGSVTVPELEEMLAAAGFVDVRVVVDERSADVIELWAPGSDLAAHIASALIEARKPV